MQHTANANSPARVPRSERFALSHISAGHQTRRAAPVARPHRQPSPALLAALEALRELGGSLLYWALIAVLFRLLFCLV